MIKFMAVTDARPGGFEFHLYINVITDDSLPLVEGEMYINEAPSTGEWFLCAWKGEYLLHGYRKRRRVIVVI